MVKTLAFTLLLFTLLPTANAQVDGKLYFYTENFPPYNMSASGRAFEHKGENIDGLCTEMVKAIMGQTDMEYIIKLRNWDYAYGRVLDNTHHGIFCTTYTEDRAPQFKWVGPLTRNLWTIFAAGDSDIEMDELEDARGKKIGGYRGDVMTQYLLKRGYTVSQLDSDDLNPKRLAMGQIDLWIADRLAGPYFASQQDVEGLKPVYSFNKTELYLAMNPDTPDAVIEKLNEALDAIRDNGMYDAIEDKYGL
ncbi:amino acid ABC transporter substrate-binding protein (PAAT family) [Tamilnaduibacter salinus]|uniref:Amino acid ABC transporter substrate-binding protein n=1 Tax=Tamilnaduibacter salinus TaxID=1484056 RepID=A0A2A2I4Y0_9GAMM|nr:transporter substrate-binding domain-containing protein [Tamilnaduibacter salinus]PAV26717.1 amino acid ABC transporter substrate-binding protein [Tamilnaduibacter salinus]PVY79120.1 amino acid ABC transporter substrate-binding protein (PAAT family) [Tamilnaduibacter salinus]